MLVVFPPIFVADTKMICGYNFVGPLKVIQKILFKNLDKLESTKCGCLNL